MAPMSSSTPAKSSALQVPPAKLQVWPAWPAIKGKSSAKRIVWNCQNTVMMPSAKPKSPTRLTTKALIAAALAVGLWNQNPMRR